MSARRKAALISLFIGAAAWTFVYFRWISPAIIRWQLEQ